MTLSFYGTILWHRREYEEKREKKGALVVEGGQEWGEERKYRINTEKDT